MADRKVEANGINGIEPAQRTGDVSSHFPPGTDVLGEPKASAETDHVRVERHDQLARRHTRPDAQIDLIPPDHPAEEQIEPLARAAGRGTRKEVTHSRPGRYATIRAPDIERQGARRERIERGADVLRVVPQTLDEERLQRSGGVHDLAENPEERDQIRSAGPAMHHRAQLRVRITGIEAAHVVRRAGAHDGQQRVD
jgi:hypothetical protein